MNLVRRMLKQKLKLIKHHQSIKRVRELKRLALIKVSTEIEMYIIFNLLLNNQFKRRSPKSLIKHRAIAPYHLKQFNLQ